LNEEDISAQQPQKEEDSWIPGEDEHQERSKCFKKETDEGEEEAERLGLSFLRMGRESVQQIEDREDHRGRILQVYKKGTDQSAPGFQKGDEVRKENLIQEFHSLFPQRREPVSPIGDCG
jgi:hypothetical protein